LWQSQQGNKLVRELQYIQQPEVFSQGRIQEVPQPVMTRFPDGTQKPLTRCAFAGANFAGGGVVQAGNFDQAPVQAGDYLEVQGGGLVHRIVAVEDSALYVYPPFDSPIPTGAPYRIFRQPRVVAGEPLLQLPQNIVVDLNDARSNNVPKR